MSSYTPGSYLLVFFLLVVLILQEFRPPRFYIDLVLKLFQPGYGQFHDRRRVRQRSPVLNTDVLFPTEAELETEGLGLTFNTMCFLEPVLAILLYEVTCANGRQREDSLVLASTTRGAGRSKIHSKSTHLNPQLLVTQSLPTIFTVEA